MDSPQHGSFHDSSPGSLQVPCASAESTLDFLIKQPHCVLQKYLWWNECVLISLSQQGSYQRLIFQCCMTPESLNHKLGALPETQQLLSCGRNERLLPDWSLSSAPRLWRWQKGVIETKAQTGKRVFCFFPRFKMKQCHLSAWLRGPQRDGSPPHAGRAEREAILQRRINQERMWRI